MAKEIYAALIESMRATRAARAEHFPTEPQLSDAVLEDLARNGAMAAVGVVGEIADLYQGKEGQ